MSSNRLLQCPYCNKKYDKSTLVTHLRNKHLDELPEGFSPLRVVFHLANKKDFNYTGKCRICKQSTNWDENKGRYDFLCGSKSCHDKYVEIMRENMGDKLGINRQTKTAEGLKKMLANRKISGTYKFNDGTSVPYTGSYERKTLEFFDNILNIKSSDIMIPGPTLSYELDGIKHFYIPDIYYIPYNLIIEVKDGGNKPNTNPQWKDTRRKQLAKEKFIIEETEFNYLRLTNNDFSQLLSVFSDLKMNLKEYNSERVIHVNENTTTIGAIHTTNNNLLIANYLQNNVFSNNSKLAVFLNDKELLLRDDNSFALERKEIDFLDNCRYGLFFAKECSKDTLNILSENIGKEVSDDFIYETIFGHKKYSNDQLLFENIELFSNN